MAGKVTPTTNKRFGRLPVVSLAGIGNETADWHCVCDCCKSCNAAKSELTESQFISHLKQILNHLGVL